jgi:hypothetical protein
MGTMIILLMMDFFWGQQFQEEQVKEYSEQDKKFISWAEKHLQEGKEIGYDCSW